MKKKILLSVLAFGILSSSAVYANQATKAGGWSSASITLPKWQGGVSTAGAKKHSNDSSATVVRWSGPSFNYSVWENQNQISKNALVQSNNTKVYSPYYNATAQKGKSVALRMTNKSSVSYTQVIKLDWSPDMP